MRRLSKGKVMYAFTCLIVILALFSCTNTDREGSRIYASKDDVIWGYQHALSPNGKWLAFATYPKVTTTPKVTTKKIYLINLEDNIVISYVQPKAISSIGWTSDSSSIIFATSTFDDNQMKYLHLLKVLDVKGGNEKNISELFDGVLFSPMVSDNSKIIFLEVLKTGEVNKAPYLIANLWTVDGKGSAAQKVAEGILGPVYSWLSKDEVCFHRGKKEKDTIMWELISKNIKTGEEKILVEDAADFHIVHNDSLFFFRKKAKKQYEIVRLSLKDYSTEQIGIWQGSSSMPILSPDGSKITFVRENQIWSLNLSSMKESRLTSKNSEIRYPIWTRDGKFIIYSTISCVVKVKAEATE